MKNTTLKSISQSLRDSVDWKSVEDVSYLSQFCNKRIYLPMKGISFEHAITQHSKGEIERVDQIGRDLIWVKRNINIEVKSQINMFQIRKSKTQKIVMKNAHGNTIQDVDNKTWDCCILIQSFSTRKKHKEITGFGVAVVAYDSYIRNYNKKDAVVQCAFPYEDLEWIVKPEDSSLKRLVEQRTRYHLFLEEILDNAMREFVTQG